MRSARLLWILFIVTLLVGGTSQSQLAAWGSGGGGGGHRGGGMGGAGASSYKPKFIPIASALQTASSRQSGIIIVYRKYDSPLVYWDKKFADESKSSRVIVMVKPEERDIAAKTFGLAPDHYPGVVVTDHYGNLVWQRKGAPSVKDLRGVTDALPKAMERLEGQLQGLLEKATEAHEKGRTRSAIDSLQKVLAYKGYAQTGSAKALLDEILRAGEAELASLATLPEADRRKRLGELKRTYRGTGLFEDLE